MLEVAKSVLEAIRKEAERAHPEECCGILLGAGDRITAIQPAANLHPTPRTHFEIDPQALIDAHREARGGGAEIVGYYHSHPTSAAMPSARDAAMAARDGKVWAIIAGESTRFWSDRKAGFCELSYSIAEE